MIGYYIQCSLPDFHIDDSGPQSYGDIDLEAKLKFNIIKSVKLKKGHCQLWNVAFKCSHRGLTVGQASS